jgi:hypothetical protein
VYAASTGSLKPIPVEGTPPMLACRVTRRGLVLGLSCLFIVAASGLAGHAQDVPAGLRVFYTGHSFHMFVPARVDQLARSAGIEAHRTAGAQGIGGSRVIQHWDLGGGDNKARVALESGQVDVFTMAAHLMIPDPGIDNFVALGLKHNPDIRFLVQASWMAFDATAPERRIRENSERDDTDLDALQTASDPWRQKLEAQVDTLNRRHGRQAVFIVPAGDAVYALRRRVKAGEFPGVAKQAEFFRDPIGHGLGHVQALVAYCNFAVIYRRSPVGLSVDERGVSDEQRAILQRIAWDVVSKYKYSGINQ